MSVLKKREHKNWLQIHIISTSIAAKDFPSLYKSVDVLVQPSRGEGWGRPHMEAMAMGVPVIATNWSGNTAFMTADNSMLISVERLSEVEEGAFKGHLWAEPSKTHLKKLMREAVNMKHKSTVTSSGAKVSELSSLGVKARAHIVSKFDNSIVAKLIVERGLKLLTDALLLKEDEGNDDF